ncbi:MAG: hypothetical protein HYX38_22085 [Rhodospirillales bacterium]|nr:hypothetical protein [Rhodospirillales bacterium]
MPKGLGEDWTFPATSPPSTSRPRSFDAVMCWLPGMVPIICSSECRPFADFGALYRLVEILPCGLRMYSAIVIGLQYLDFHRSVTGKRNQLCLLLQAAA